MKSQLHRHHLGIIKFLVFLNFMIFISAIFTSSLLAQDPFAYIANSGSGTISVVDLTDLSTNSISVGNSPYYIKKSPIAEQLWFTDYSYGYLKVLDLNTGSIIFQNNLYNAQEIIISPDGLLAYVAYSSYPVEVKVYDATNFTEIYNYSVTNASYADDIALSQNGDVLYLLYNSYFYAINPVNGIIQNTVYLNYYANRIVLSPDYQYAYVYGDDYYIQKINLQTFTFTSVNIGDQAYASAISPDGQSLYVGFYYQSSIKVYNTTTLQQTSTISMASEYVTDLRVSSGGTDLYVLHRYSPNFEIYDIQTGLQQTSLSTGSYSYRFDFETLPADSLPPHPISNLNADEISFDSALLTWTAAYDDSLTEPVKGYEVRFDTVAITQIDSAQIYQQSIVPGEPGETDSLLIKNLLEETSYWVAIRTFDEAHNFSDPAIIQFTTLLPPEISVSISSLNFTVAIGDTVEESFTITNAAGSGGAPLIYQTKSEINENEEGFAYIANATSGTISVIDLTDQSINNIYVGNNPYYIKKSPIANQIWFTDPDYNYLKVLDLSSGSIVYQYYLNNIEEIIFSPNGHLAYVVYGSYPVGIQVFDATDFSVKYSFSVSNASYANDIALSKEGDILYLLYGNDFYAINPTNGNIINNVYLNYYADRIVLSPDYQYAYIYGDYYYIQKINLQTFTFTTSDVGDQANALAVSPDGQRLYVGFYYQNLIIVYNATTLQQVSTIAMSSEYVTDLRASSDGTSLYVLHRYSPNFEIYNIQSGQLQSSISTGSYSYRFDFSAASINFVETDPKSGSIAAGESKEISLVINASKLKQKEYNVNLVINSNDPVNPEMIIPLIINALDQTGPDFNMTFFVNPYLSRDLKILVFAHEELPSMPQLKVGDTTSVNLAIQDSIFHIYLAKYELTGSADFTFTVSGDDSLGNHTSFTRILSAESIPLGKPGFISHKNGEISVSFPANSFEKELYVIVWEESEVKAGTTMEEKVCHIGPEGLNLNETANLEIAYPDGKEENFDPLHFFIYKQGQNGQWEQLTSFVNKNKKVVCAEINQLGVYKVGYDPSSYSEEITSIPTEYNLSQNYPNPFNPTTTIYYALPNPGLVNLKIYDILGREVKTLVDKPQKAGEYWITFDAGKLASGIYFYRLKSGDFNQTKRMMLLK